MFGNSSGSRKAGAHWRSALQHWPMLSFALLLALGLGGAGQMPRVSAAPAGDSQMFSMVLVGKPKTKLCVGKTETYRVKVEFEQPMLPTPAPGPLGGLAAVNIKVDATSKDPSVADFSGAATANTTVTASEDLSGLLVASFPLKAKKAGATILYFEALVHGEYVTLNLPVQVKDCAYRATTIGEWHLAGPAHIFIAATSNDAEVKPDGQGNFTGSASVNWVASVDQVGDCAGAFTIGSSQVNWSGVMSDNDQLTLSGTYMPAAGSMNGVCTADGTHFGTDGSVATDSMHVDLTPDPLQVSVGSSALDVQQSQVLEGPEAMSGTVTIIIVPEDESAAAFVPDHERAGWAEYLHPGALLAWH